MPGEGFDIRGELPATPEQQAAPLKHQQKALRQMLDVVLRKIIRQVCAMEAAPEGIEFFDWRHFAEDYQPDGLYLPLPGDRTELITPQVGGEVSIVDLAGIAHRFNWSAGWDRYNRIAVLWAGSEDIFRRDEP
jgi:hypothetical protein